MHTCTHAHIHAHSLTDRTLTRIPPPPPPPPPSSREEHILPTLVSVLKETSRADPWLRRRALAALGETIFYLSRSVTLSATLSNAFCTTFSTTLGLLVLLLVPLIVLRAVPLQKLTLNIITPHQPPRPTCTPSQQEDVGSGANAEVASKWGLGSPAFAALLKCLRDDNDEVVKHYAAKTVENILAVGSTEFQRKVTHMSHTPRIMHHAPTPQIPSNPNPNLPASHLPPRPSSSPWTWRTGFWRSRSMARARGCKARVAWHSSTCS